VKVETAPFGAARFTLPAGIARDRMGRVITPALWLGPAEGPDAATCVMVVCPHCRVEMVIEPTAPTATRWERKVVKERDAQGELLIVAKTVATEHCGHTVCLNCGASLALRIRGRYFEPWRLGTGIVKPMPAFPVAKDEPPAQGGGV
jgi:hypothetical protein